MSSHTKNLRKSLDLISLVVWDGRYYVVGIDPEAPLGRMFQQLAPVKVLRTWPIGGILVWDKEVASRLGLSLFGDGGEESSDISASDDGADVDISNYIIAAENNAWLDVFTRGSNPRRLEAKAFRRAGAVKVVCLGLYLMLPWHTAEERALKRAYVLSKNWQAADHPRILLNPNHGLRRNEVKRSVFKSLGGRYLPVTKMWAILDGQKLDRFVAAGFGEHFRAPSRVAHGALVPAAAPAPAETAIESVVAAPVVSIAAALPVPVVAVALVAAPVAETAAVVLVLPLPTPVVEIAAAAAASPSGPLPVEICTPQKELDLVDAATVTPDNRVGVLLAVAAPSPSLTPVQTSGVALDVGDEMVVEQGPVGTIEVSASASTTSSTDPRVHKKPKHVKSIVF